MTSSPLLVRRFALAPISMAAPIAPIATLAIVALLASACHRETSPQESKLEGPRATSISEVAAPSNDPSLPSSIAANERELALSEGSRLEVSQDLSTPSAPLAPPSVESERIRRLAAAERDLAVRERAVEAREARLAESREGAAPLTTATTAPQSEPLSDSSEADLIPDLTPLEPEEIPKADAERARSESEPLPTAPPAEVPSGTEISAELLSELSSESSVAGQAFRTRISADVEIDGEVAIPAGSEVHGYVVEARAARAKEAALLELRVTDLVLPTGETYPLSATLLHRGKSDTGRDAATVGGAVAGGAILGRAAAGKGSRGKGAFVGAILGAVVGAVVAARTPGEEVLLPRGEILDLRLDRALSIGARP